MNPPEDYPPSYGVAFFKLLPDEKRKLLLKKMFWHVFTYLNKPKSQLYALFNTYTSSLINKYENFTFDLSPYFQEINALLKQYPKHHKMHHELEYLKELFILFDAQENVQLLFIPFANGNELFIPQAKQKITPALSSSRVFTEEFPIGVIFSFLFDKITFKKFLNKFEKEYKVAISTETSSENILSMNLQEYNYTVKELLDSILNVSKKFNSNTHSIRTLKTEISKYYGQIGYQYLEEKKDYFKLLIQFIHNNIIWKVEAPRTHVWFSDHIRDYFSPFAKFSYPTFPGYNFTWILATLELNFNKKLELWVNFIHAIEMKKTIYEIEESKKEYVYKINENKIEESIVAISLSKAEVSFTNNEVYFVKEGKKIYGKEIGIANLCHTTIIPQSTYQLNSDETLFSKNIYLNLEQENTNADSYSFSTFYFKFPLGSKDYNNTEFVLEGLSYQDKPLPPLKVHLNYVEAEEPYEKTTIKEVPPDYFYEHGLALYKTDSEGEKELITKKLFRNYAKYIGKATEDLPGFKEHFNFYKPIILKITKNNHSILTTLLKETEILGKQHTEHTEIAKEISELYSFLMLANSLESCFIYDSPDPYNDKLFLSNKIDSSYIFDIRPLEKLIIDIINSYTYGTFLSPTEFTKKFSELYVMEESKGLDKIYNYNDRKILASMYLGINLKGQTSSHDEQQKEIGKLFGLFSKVISTDQKDFFKPLIYITQFDTSWVLHTQSLHSWTYRYDRLLLPGDFLNRGVEALPGNNYTCFFGKIILEKEKELAVMVNFLDIKEKRRFVLERFETYKEYEFIKEGSTYHETTVTLSFTNQEIDFDNSKVYFLMNGEKKMGKEVNTVFLQEEGCAELGEHVYTLNSDEVLLNNKVCLQIDEDYISPEAKKNPEIEYEPYRETGPFVFSSYFFKFPITCEEYENAEFVLDGLSYNGQALPPLKIRINYVKDYELSLKKHK